MKILWVYAHPEPRSLSGSLRDEALAVLAELGHEVRQSDLYAMKWNPVVDRADYAVPPAERLVVAGDSQEAFDSGELAADVVQEQEKLDWADTVVLQFPLWWYGMPAIMKGWVDRVFVKGFGYGITDESGRVLRYGEGRLAGKRALVVTTAGGRPSAMGPRGVSGDLERHVLFPLLHGTFWYTGLSPLPPFVVYSADRTDAEGFAAAAKALRSRLESLEVTDPIPYRYQNSDDYTEDQSLRPDLAPGRTDLDIHLI